MGQMGQTVSPLSARLWLLVPAVAWGMVCVGAESDDRQVERFIRDLNGASAAVRDAAEKALLGRGPLILPQVTAARGRAVGEAAFRLRGIQHRREEAATRATVEAALDTLVVTVGGVDAVAGGTAARLVLQAAWGPELRMLAMRLPMRSIVADGPGGEAMPPTHRTAVVEPAVPPGTVAVDLPVVLAQPEHRLEALATLRGTLMLWLAGMEHTFELPLDAVLPRTMRVGQATVTLADVVIRHDGGRITASVVYDEPTEALASHRPWLAARLIEVVDGEGRSLSALDQATVARSERGVTAEVSFRLGERSRHGAGVTVAGLRMRWRLPLAIHEVSRDFVVRDVALPVAHPVDDPP